jgi:PhnB protein
MRSAYLTLTVDTIGEAERIYSLLTDGGEIFTPMAETFFAACFAMFRDKACHPSGRRFYNNDDR